MRNRELVRLYCWLRAHSHSSNRHAASDRLGLLDTDQLHRLAARIRAFAETQPHDTHRMSTEEAWALSYLRDASPGQPGPPTSLDPNTCLLGYHPDVASVRASLDAFAQSSEPVLFVGDRGCGKGQLMRAIDQRRQTRFGFSGYLAVSLATVSAELSDSALFGHRKGSFTGAVSSRSGAFRTALADNRALFLDDIGDCAPTVQAKLLAAIDDGKFTPVGADQNVDLGRGADRQLAIYAAIQPEALSKLRPDLFDRLGGSIVWLPSLRERGMDVLLLADHLMEQHRDCAGESSLSIAARELLLEYEWPGNIRQLANIVHRARDMAGSTQIVDGTTLSQVLQSEQRIQSLLAGAQPLRHRSTRESDGFPTLREVEYRHIVEAVERCRGNKTQAAELLGIPRTTLYSKLKGVPEATLR